MNDAAIKMEKLKSHCEVPGQKYYSNDIDKVTDFLENKKKNGWSRSFVF